jgi:hypothetical protein
MMENKTAKTRKELHWALQGLIFGLFMFAWMSISDYLISDEPFTGKRLAFDFVFWLGISVGFAYFDHRVKDRRQRQNASSAEGS